MDLINIKKVRTLFLLTIIVLSFIPFISFGKSASAAEIENPQATVTSGSVYSDADNLDIEFLNADPSFIKPSPAKKLTSREKNCLVALGLASAGALTGGATWGSTGLAFVGAAWTCYNG